MIISSEQIQENIERTKAERKARAEERRRLRELKAKKVKVKKVRIPKTMSRGPSMNPELNEQHNRLEWWLREHGHPPTREAIIAMRTHKDYVFKKPKQGKSALSRRIAKAVDNHEWQVFREGLKGTSTEAKLFSLRDYWNSHHDEVEHIDIIHEDHEFLDCDVCIRVDNYIKALCRGGQLYPNESLATALRWHFKLIIQK